jgi:hypothetical protein
MRFLSLDEAGKKDNLVVKKVPFHRKKTVN